MFMLITILNIVIAVALVLVLFQHAYKRGKQKGFDLCNEAYVRANENILKAEYESGFNAGRIKERQVAMLAFQEVLPEIRNKIRNESFEEAMKNLEETWKQIDL